MEVECIYCKSKNDSWPIVDGNGEFLSEVTVECKNCKKKFKHKVTEEDKKIIKQRWEETSNKPWAKIA
ncbi:MAG: hypothetical protein Q7R70_05820 [Candidatus Diapherotrites archaeon]|nr:hypothetical protein [Candidatus Diapherotrites archaeon]